KARRPGSPTRAWRATPSGSAACARRRRTKSNDSTSLKRKRGLQPSPSLALQACIIMLFHTWVFFVFFAVVYPVYLLVRKNNLLMNVWLMIASYTFYSWWNPAYLLLLFGTSAIDYVMVLLMERKQSTRTLWLVVSLVSNFGFLGYFKYSGFLTENLNALLAYFHAPYLLPH